MDGHEEFAARTREMCRAAGIDLDRAGHWKHDYIPLDQAAAQSKFHGHVPKGWHPPGGGKNASGHPRHLGSMAHGETPEKASAGQSNAVALMQTIAAKQEARTRMAKAGIPVPPAQGDMKPGAASDEYVRASDLMYAGKYAEASAALAKAITAANERREPQAAKRLTAYKARLDKALAKPG